MKEFTHYKCYSCSCKVTKEQFEKSLLRKCKECACRFWGEHIDRAVLKLKDKNVVL